MELLILTGYFIGFLFFIWVVLSILNGAPVTGWFGSYVSAENEYHAKVLVQVFMLPETLKRYAKGEVKKNLTNAEFNILTLKFKAVLTKQILFEIRYGETKKFSKWLKDPRLNEPYQPNNEVMDEFCHIPLPPKFAEKMLKKIYKKEYSEYYHLGKCRLEVFENAIAPALHEILEAKRKIRQN